MKAHIPVWILIAVIFASSAFAQPLQFDSTSKEKPRPAAEKSTMADDDYERVETRLVVSAVQVFDKKGSKVKGLSHLDFEVREEGELQEIQSVTYGGSGATGHSVVLVIDYSSSMVPYMETSLKAAETLVSVLGPNDQLAIVSDDVEVLADFSSDKALLLEKIDSIRGRFRSGITGKSKQFCALMRTLRELAPRAVHPPIVIFQTDGDQYALLKGMPGAALNSEKNVGYSFHDVIDVAAKSGTTIYTVSPGRFVGSLPKDARAALALAEDQAVKRYVEATSDVRYVRTSSKLSPRFLSSWFSTRSRDQGAIIEIAQKSGGWAEDLTAAGESQELYSRILRADAGYVVAYYPKNQAFDGAKRKVVVTLRNNPGYSIRGQKSYVAGSSKF